MRMLLCLARTFARQVRQRPRTCLVVFLLALGATAVAVPWALARYHYRAAAAALGEERYADAERHVRSCLAFWPGDESAYLLAARTLRLRGDYPGAEEFLRRTLAEKGASDALQLEWLLLRAQAGEAEAVESQLWETVEQRGSEAVAILDALARAHMHDTRLPSALRVLNRWLELDPDCARALDWRGWVLENMRREEAAVRDYRRALELAPGRDEVRLRLANLLLGQDRYEDAEVHLEALRRSRPGRTAVRVGLARCRQLRGRPEEARRLFEAVLVEEPGNHPARFYRAVLALEGGRPAEAEPDLRHVLREDPFHLNARYRLSGCLKELGRDDEAARELARWRQDKDDVDRLRLLLKGQADGTSSGPEGPSEVGRMFLRLGNDRLGLHWLETALRRAPWHRPTHEALARYYEARNEPTRAAEHHRLAAEGGPQTRAAFSPLGHSR